MKLIGGHAARGSDGAAFRGGEGGGGRGCVLFQVLGNRTGWSRRGSAPVLEDPGASWCFKGNSARNVYLM